MLHRLKAVKIAPEFVSDSGDEITDVVEWEILTGADFIKMTVADDGKSISVLPTGNGCGSASIRIKAGQVEKVIYVNVAAPANSVTLSPKNRLNMMYGEEKMVSATLGYSSKYSDMATDYPDNVTFSSSNDSVVKIVKTIDTDGKVVCTLQAVGAGTATITVLAGAGNISETLKVYVASDNLKLILKDGEGKQVADGKTEKIRNSSGVSYSYELSETIGSNELIMETSDPSVAKAMVSSLTDKITIRAYKTGKANIVIYPAVGTKKNGITISVDANSDISTLRLANKSIPEGCTESVFTSVTNAFDEKVTVAKKYSEITDNRLVFTSDNPEYASVDAYGNVTVKKYSQDIKNVVITCTAYDSENKVVKTVSTTVTLQKPMVKNVIIKGNTTVNVGKTVKYSLSVTPANGGYTRIAVNYVSGSYRIADYVLSNDYKTLTVKGVSSGTVTLNIEVKNGTTVLVSKKLKVTVNKPIVKTPGKVKWAKCKGAKKKASLKWKKTVNASGYEIQMSVKKSKGYRTVKIISSAKH